MTASPPFDHAVADYASQRGITQVLHFTTDKGLTGIFAKEAVLSRERLSTEDYLEFVYTPNCLDRSRDADWHGYVNLSISRVNGSMFKISSERWHATEDLWWAVLEFAPSILSDEGVWFTTTNNAYYQFVQRAQGVEGLAAMFADRVPWGKYGSIMTRGTKPDWLTTDPQAEVLYPGEIPVDRVTAVYVREAEHADHVHSLLEMFPPGREIVVAHNPEVFQ